MKQLKKIASIMLALVMVLAMAIPVMAASTGSTERGTITINNATVENTYTIYKIFDIESYDKDKKSYSYTVASDWEGFVGSEADTSGFVSVQDGYVKVEDRTRAADFAKDALAYATAQRIGNQGQKTASSTTVEFNNLDLGYYLVDSTVGALCSLDTTNPTVEIQDKNEKPKIDKEVQEGTDENGYGKVNDANIGDTVTFKATITAQEGAQNYVMHDEMSVGLTYNGVSEIKLNPGTNKEKILQEGTDYTVKVQDAISDTCTFEIFFEQSFCDTLEKDDKIVVTYTATVNEDAISSMDPDTNKATLDYGEDNHTETSTTKTYVWSFDLNKRDGSKDDKPLLAGAIFKLCRDKNGDDAIQFIKDDDNHYRVAKANETDTINTFTTNENGAIKLSGLDAGTYYLIEEEQPAGYNKLTSPVTVEIAHKIDNNDDYTSTIKYDTNGGNNWTSSDTGAVDVENNTGTVLPSTGGIGTTIFYVVGGILVVGAAIVLVAKKRTKDE